MTERQSRDLLVIARERSSLYDVVQRLGDYSGVEIRVDRRSEQRRRAEPAPLSEERRRRERRTLEVNEQLRTEGWAFVAAADRG